MPGNPLVRFDEGRVGRTARCRLLSYSTERSFFELVDDTRDAVLELRSCFLCTGATVSTDLISTMTLSSTTRSA